MANSQKVETEHKWVSKYGNGDFVHHVTGTEKRVITSVQFDSNCQPQYCCQNETDAKWWNESECVRTIKGFN